MKKTAKKNFLHDAGQRVKIYFSNPDRRTRFWSLLALLGLLLVWWQVIRWYRSQLLEEQRLNASEEVSLRGTALSASLNRRFSLLRGLDAYIRIIYNQDDFGDKFLAYASNLYKDTSGILNIAVAPDGSILHIYPLEGNEDFIGYDLLLTVNPDLKEDIQLALDTEEIILGFPLDFTQSVWGLAARKAIYLEDGTFWGLISIVMDVHTLMHESGLLNGTPNLDFRLVDRSGKLIYETGPIKDQQGINYTLGLPEEPWQLIGYPKVNWNEIIFKDLLPIQISGLIIILLLSGLVYVSVNRQARLAIAVEERTREIATINLSLEQRVEARTREITTLMEVSQTVATAPDVVPLLSLILDQLQEIVACVDASIFLLENEHRLNLLYFRGQKTEDAMPSHWTLEGADHFEEVIQSRRPVVIPDVSNDSPLAIAWQRTMKSRMGLVPDNLCCWMGIPLIVKSRVIGLLALHQSERNYYSDEQASLALAFAHQAALAIENARLYDQVQQVAVLRERQRMARELHDSVSQALYSITLGARTVQTLIHRYLKKDVQDILMEPVMHVLSMAEAGLAEMRALIFELRPESLEVEGLITASTKQITAFQSRYKIEVQTNLCDEPDIPMDKKLLLYRVVQESLHNIAKHAHANRVKVELSCLMDKISLMVQDNGRGFDISIPSQGLGLRSMRERVEEGGGVFEVLSAPDQGTSIVVQLPLDIKQ